MDIKGEINRNTVIVRDFNTLLTSMDGSSRQKINKETVALNDTLDKVDLAFHPKAVEYTYFSSAHRTFSMIDHRLGHKKQGSINLRRLKSHQAFSLATML